MNNIETIINAVELIESHLKSEMSVFSLSSDLGFSFYYFSRLFKGITGYSPKTYILKRKMSEAAADIVKSEKKIIEIAFDYGFSTPESFSRSFQKILGINPSQLRKSGDLKIINFFPKISGLSFSRCDEFSEQEPVLVELERLNLAGIPFYHSLKSRNDLTEEWSILLKNVLLLKNRLIPERYYQVQYWFDDQDPGTIFFLVAAEVTSAEEIPVQFTLKTMPAQTYLKFIHKGLANKIGHTYQYIYEKWLPESEYKLPYLYNFEFYGKENKGPFNEDSITEIYIPVKI